MAKMKAVMAAVLVMEKEGVTQAFGVPGAATYSASKFALHGAADALRAELWGTGVTVGLVCPSSTTTEFQQRIINGIGNFGRCVNQRSIQIKHHQIEI